MALNAHLESLTKRHQDLDAALMAETKRPSSDDHRIHELKRSKLRIKDQIAELQRQHTEET
ncbi:MAG: DUF465 domain-containing protein [Pseudomonadota bacterium]